MTKNTLMKNTLYLLQAIAIDTKDKGFLKILKRLFNIFVFFIAYVDFILIILYKWKRFETIIEITIYMAFVHIGYKLTSTMLKERHYISVFKEISKFTKWENLNGAIRKDIDDTEKLVLILTKCYIVCAIGVLIGHSLSPLWSDFERLTPLDSYFSKYFDNTVFYLFVYVLQEVELLLLLSNILNYDVLLFASVITNINIEIRIIKHQIKKISAEDVSSVTDIYKLVTQHNNVLRFIKQCDAIFSDVLLIQFFSSTLVLSIGLFAIVESGFPPSMYVVTKSGIFFSAAMAQLLLFCTLGQSLINETQSISDAIYNIKWWIKPQPELKRACLLIIQRANKLDRLSAGGIFVVDYQAYTQVVKFGFSLFSVLQAMKSRTENF